jgi:glutaredoxin
MKLITVLSVCLLFGINGYSQKKDIDVFEKKSGNKNIVIARNTGNVPYLVTLSITCTGMKVSPGIRVQSIVPAGYMSEMATLEPIPGESWSYGFEVSFIESTETAPKTSALPATSPDTKPTVATSPDILSEDAIIVYSKPSCGRCTMIKKEMNSKGVAFEEIDITTASPDVNDMWQKLRDSGFTGTSVTMPVVRYNGEFHYNIKDIPGLVEKMRTGTK